MTTTVSIGSGRATTTIQSAWNALPSTLGDDYVFELDKEGFSTLDTSASAKTMNGHTVTIRPATGAGFKDTTDAALRIDTSTGAYISGTVGGGGVMLLDRTGIILDGLMIRNTSGGYAVRDAASTGNTIRNCILEATYSGSALATALYSEVGTVTNCVIINKDSAGGGVYFSGGGTIKGCTVVYIGSGTSTGKGIRNDWAPLTAIDNAIFGFTTACDPGNSSFHSSSDYNATDASSTGTGTGTHNVVSKTYANQFTSITSGSENLRVKAGSDLVAGVTDAALTLDIIGTTRAGTPTIGAHEYVAAASSDRFVKGPSVYTGVGSQQPYYYGS